MTSYYMISIKLCCLYTRNILNERYLIFVELFNSNLVLELSILRD